MTPGNLDDESGDNKRGDGNASWGPKLFYGALLGSLVFFWWLLIYSHGVAPHGG